MPDNSKIRSLLTDAAVRGANYRENAAERHVAPSREAIAGVERFIEPMPEAGTDDNEVLAILDEVEIGRASCRERV